MGQERATQQHVLLTTCFPHKVPVVMTSFVKILEAIQNNKDRESDLISRLNRTRLVIFDDLGAERGTDYALEKVYNIIDERYRKKLPMILTTNLTLDEMKRRKLIFDTPGYMTASLNVATRCSLQVLAGGSVKHPRGLMR